MLLGDFLAELLRGRGIDSIHLEKKVLRKLVESKADYLQWLSILLLNGRVRICIDEHYPGNIIYERSGVKLLYGRNGILSQYYARWKNSECKKDITGEFYNQLKEHATNLRNVLLFIIDLSLWDEHTESEKRELVEQVMICIKLVRTYLYDKCIVITSCNREFIDYFNYFNRNMRSDVEMLTTDLRRYLRNIIKTHRIAMLDPEGDHVLTDADVRSFNCYIIGGIIDKERVDRFGTFRLYNLYRLHELNIPRFRICLDSSKIGVPDRINKIMEIIIRAKLFRKNLRDSIIEAQTKRDRIYRWYYEIQKYSKKVIKNGRIIKHIIDKNFLNRLISTYPISEKDIERILRSLKVEIVE